MVSFSQQRDPRVADSTRRTLVRGGVEGDRGYPGRGGLSAETLKLGGFQRACGLLGGTGVRAGEDDALHQRAHW